MGNTLSRPLALQVHSPPHAPRTLGDVTLDADAPLVVTVDGGGRIEVRGTVPPPQSDRACCSTTTAAAPPMAFHRDAGPFA